MDIDPGKILEITDAFMASKYLFAAERAGLFEALADGPADPATLEKRTGIPAERLRIVADAVVALGLVERTTDRYRNGPEAQAFLSGRGAADLRPALRYRDQVSYDMWSGFPRAISEGRVEPRELDEEEVALFSDAMAAFTGGMARGLVDAYDWTGHDRVLDVGGGRGHWLHVLLDQHDHLEGTLFELPRVAGLASDEAPDELAGRLEVVAGDALEDPLPRGHDAIVVANVLHQFPPGTNRHLLQRLRDAVEPGARLLLADTWTTDGGTEPVSAALLSGEFLMFSGQGRSYRVGEAREWLEEVGWRLLEHAPLGGPGSVLVAEA